MTARDQTRGWWRRWGWLALALALLPLTISTRSLWIDEAQTVAYAQQPSFAAWLHTLLGDRYSEAQMPLAMFLGWVSAQTLGTGSEWQLRALNLLWGAAALVAAAGIGRRLRMPWLPLFFAVQPFFWYYLDEARPYALQIAGGAWLLLGALLFLRSRGRHPQAGPALFFAALVLCGSSLLAVIPVGVTVVLLAVSVLRGRARLDRRAWGWAAAGLVCLLPLGLYYVWTLTKGAGGAKFWTVSGSNLGFAFYEFSGASGLGPSRLELRNLGVGGGVGGALRGLAGFAPGLGALGLAYAAAASGIGRVRRQPSTARALRFCALSLGCSALTLFALAIVAKFPFWGRHLAPVFAPWVVLTALPAAAAGRKLAGSPFRDGRVVAAAVAALGVLLLLSSLQLRFSPRHAKDDYRNAVRLAREHLAADGASLWWAADPRAAAYYGLPLRPAAPGAPGPNAMSAGAAAARPGLVVLSRPQIYDPAGVLRDYLAREGFQPVETLTAFEFFRPPTVGPEKARGDGQPSRTERTPPGTGPG